MFEIKTFLSPLKNQTIAADKFANYPSFKVNQFIIFVPLIFWQLLHVLLLNKNFHYYLNFAHSLGQVKQSLTNLMEGKKLQVRNA